MNPNILVRRLNSEMRILGIAILIVGPLVFASFTETSASWPNQPSGSTVLSTMEYDCLVCNGFYLNASSLTHIFNDPTSPGATKNVLRMRFPVGAPGGSGVGNSYFLLPGTGVKDMYAGFYWKPGASWNSAPGTGQKINFMVGGNNSWGVILLFYQGRINVYYPVQAEYNINNCHVSPSWGDCPGTRQIYANGYNPTITLDRWYRLELYVKISTTSTSRDGIILWWIDGQLAGKHTNVNFPTHGIIQYETNATWASDPNIKNQTEFYVSYDQLRLATGGSVPIIDIPFMITSSVQTSAQIGKPYSTTLQAENGKAPYSWTISAGSLPPGLTLNKTTGILSGTPTVVGRSDFTVKVMDSSVPAAEATKAFMIVVSSNPAGINAGRLAVNGSRLTAKPERASVMFGLPQNGNTSLKVYDLTGREVWSHTGSGEAVWNHSGKLQKGIYLIRAEQNGNAYSTRFCNVR